MGGFCEASIFTSWVEVLYEGLLYVRLLTPGSANFDFLCLTDPEREW